MINRFLWTIIVAILTTGCTPSAFLKPEASSGSYSTENPACGGNPEVLEFSPEKQNWVIFRVYARQIQAATQNHPQGTVLLVGFWIRPFIGITNLGAIFANESEKAIATERYHREYTVTSSKSSVTVELPGGISREIHITYLESPYQLMQRDYTFWPPPVQIDPGSVDEFTVVFPDIFVNGEKLFVPPIHFKKASGGNVNLILNC